MDDSRLVRYVREVHAPPENYAPEPRNPTWLQLFGNIETRLRLSALRQQRVSTGQQRILLLSPLAWELHNSPFRLHVYGDGHDGNLTRGSNDLLLKCHRPCRHVSMLCLMVLQRLHLVVGALPKRIDVDLGKLSLTAPLCS